MKLKTKEESQAYQALVQYGNNTQAVEYLSKEGIDKVKAKRILSNLEKKIEKHNRSAALPKIGGGLLFTVIIFIAMSFVSGPIVFILLIPLGLGIVKFFQGIFQYLVPSNKELDSE